MQDQVALTEPHKALASVRFERFEHDYDDYLNTTRDFTKNQNAVTPRFGLIYDLTDAIAVRAAKVAGSIRKKANPMNLA